MTAIDRIQDVFDRFLSHGKEPNEDDLWILHEYYDDREHRSAIYRLDDSLRARYRHADIAALKQRWLALPLPLPHDERSLIWKTERLF